MLVATAAVAGGLALGAAARVVVNTTHEADGRQSTSAPARIALGKAGRTIPLGEDNPPYSLDGSVVTFPSSSPGRYLDQVEQVDVESGSRSVVARTAFPRGFINWAVGTGEWVVYADQSRRQSDGAPRVLWRVLAQHTATGERRVLASNGDTPDPFVPRVFSAQGYVYWSSAEPDRTARETLWRPAWPAPRPLLEREMFVPASETIADGWLYYQDDPAHPHPDPLAADCWRIPLSGGKPEPVTDSAFVMSCHPQGDRLAWTEHIDPATEEPPAGGVVDDPYELWTREVGGKPTLLHRGYFGWGGPVVAGDFTIWSDWSGHTKITSLRRPDISTTVADDAPRELALVDGDRIVILTTKGGTDYAQVYDLDQVRVVG